jgi:hypothetical protein
VLKGLALIREFTSRYRSRIVAGLATYGEFDPATDTRCLSAEAIEECLDIGSYLEMLEEKWPELTPQVNKVRVKTIGLYADLRGLEALERTQGKEGIR